MDPQHCWRHGYMSNPCRVSENFGGKPKACDEFAIYLNGKPPELTKFGLILDWPKLATALQKLAASLDIVDCQFHGNVDVCSEYHPPFSVSPCVSHIASNISNGILRVFFSQQLPSISSSWDDSTPSSQLWCLNIQGSPKPLKITCHPSIGWENQK